MTLNTNYQSSPLSSTSLTLDTIISAAFYFAGKWEAPLRRNQSRDVLRLILYKLYAAPGGSLFHRHARSSQAALADKLDLSREWVNKLLARLKLAGWIETTAPRLPDGKQEITQFRPGRMLKRVLVLLLKSRQRQKSRVNTSSKLFPPRQDRARAKAFFADLIQTLGQKLGPPKAART